MARPALWLAVQVVAHVDPPGDVRKAISLGMVPVTPAKPGGVRGACAHVTSGPDANRASV